MSFTLALGAVAPDFTLPGTDGKTHSLGDFADAKALVIAFTCNHCPMAIGSEDRMNAIYADYSGKGMAMVSINSNELVHHPDDSFDHMVVRAKEKGFQFPYLRDESQEVALAYGALRTPHFYLFDGDGKLAYTGRMDDNPGVEAEATTRELRDAIEAVLEGKTPAAQLSNPIGCNVKWIDQDAHWMPAEAKDLV